MSTAIRKNLSPQLVLSKGFEAVAHQRIKLMVAQVVLLVKQPHFPSLNTKGLYL